MATSTGLLLACPAGKEGSIGIHRCRVQILGAEPLGRDSAQMGSGAPL